MARDEKERAVREERIKKMVAAINKSEGGDFVTWLGSGDIAPLERFPSGCVELDIALGGGWPVGRFIEVFGPESGGKSTVCLHAIAEFQKKYPDKDVALVDVEFSFDEIYAKAIGVDTEFLIISQPDSGEQALQVVRHLMQMGVGLIVVDSVAALTTRAEMEGSIGDQTVGEQARLMSRALRMMQAEVGQKRCSIFFTNQMREKIGQAYGDKTTTSGGRALRHYASIRASIAAIQKDKEGDDIVGSKVKVDVKKNKTAPPFKSAEFYISYGKGIDSVAAICDAVLAAKVVDKRGAWISFEDQMVGQGRKDFIENVRKDEELRKKLTEALKNPPPVSDSTKEETKPTKGYKKPKVLVAPTEEGVLPQDGAVDEGEVKVSDV